VGMAELCKHGLFVHAAVLRAAYHKANACPWGERLLARHGR
jgi:hypothetical protein